MEETFQEKQAILNAVKNEKIVQNYQESESIIKYFQEVEKAKKELKKTHPEIPEQELDLYL